MDEGRINRTDPIALRAVERVRELHAQGWPLNIEAVRRKAPDLLAVAFTVEPFWGWRGLLETAGISYSDIAITLEPDVVCLLCGARLRNIGTHLRVVHETDGETYRDEFPGAEVLCEERRSALMLRWDAKLRMPHWEPLWSDEYVLDRIYFQHSKGYSLQPLVVQQEEPSLFGQAERRFGSYDEALTRAGLDPLDHRATSPFGLYSTEEAVVAGIQSRHERGLPISFTEVAADHHTLVKHAVRLFGNWDAALSAAGFDPTVARRCRSRDTYGTRDEVTKEIRRRHREGLPLNVAAVTRGERPDGLLWTKARAHFGSWDDALRAAGVDPATVRKIGRRGRYATPEKVIERLRKRAKAGEPMAALAVERSEPTLYNHTLRHFGSWRAALLATGLNPDEHIHSPAAWSSPAAKTRQARGRYATPDKVIERLRELATEQKPLAAGKVGRDEPTLYNWALRHFDSWRAALLAAGFDPDEHGASRKSKLYGTPEAIMAAVKERHAQGLALNAAALEKGETRDVPLIRRARLTFGSWDDALRAAGFDPADIRICAGGDDLDTPDGIIAAIKERHAAGLRMNNYAMQKGTRESRRLLRRALVHFGSWDAALTAAGFDPDEFRLRRPNGLLSTSEGIITALREHHAAGLPLVGNQMKAVRGGAGSLYRAAVVHFGSWDAALHAAGLS